MVFIHRQRASNWKHSSYYYQLNTHVNRNITATSRKSKYIKSPKVLIVDLIQLQLRCENNYPLPQTNLTLPPRYDISGSSTPSKPDVYLSYPGPKELLAHLKCHQLGMAVDYTSKCTN